MYYLTGVLLFCSAQVKDCGQCCFIGSLDHWNAFEMNKRQKQASRLEAIFEIRKVWIKRSYFLYLLLTDLRREETPSPPMIAESLGNTFTQIYCAWWGDISLSSGKLIEVYLYSSWCKVSITALSPDSAYSKWALHGDATTVIKMADLKRVNTLQSWPVSCKSLSPWLPPRHHRDTDGANDDIFGDGYLKLCTRLLVFCPEG